MKSKNVVRGGPDKIESLTSLLELTCNKTSAVDQKGESST